MPETPTPTTCDRCFREDRDCVPYDPPWDEYGTCPACLVDNMPPTENCDVCGHHVEREVFALFSVVLDQDRPVAFRHGVCDVERRLT